jgi:hypothetical protein
MLTGEQARDLVNRVRAAIDAIEVTEGTEKQVEWARRIKVEQRNHLVGLVRDSVTFDYTPASVRAWVDFIVDDWAKRPARRDAKWWIDGRNSTLWSPIREQAKKKGIELVSL